MTRHPRIEHVLRSARVAALLAAVHGLCTAAPALAQDEAVPAPGWTNETELSLALTGGNSTARTFGFGDTVRHIRESSRLQIRVSGIRSGTAGDRFLLVDPGVRFPIAGAPEDPETRLVRPGVDTEVENYLVSGRYEMEISERFFWNAGGSWDRNSDAGILNRYTAFAGVGNVWSDGDTVRFSTSYAASYTNRSEETRDPGKDPRFAGARLGWDYRQRLGEATLYENELTANVNLTAASDYSFNMTHAVSVALSTQSGPPGRPAVAVRARAGARGGGGGRPGRGRRPRRRAGQRRRALRNGGGRGSLDNVRHAPDPQGSPRHHLPDRAGHRLLTARPRGAGGEWCRPPVRAGIRAPDGRTGAGDGGRKKAAARSGDPALQRERQPDKGAGRAHIGLFNRPLTRFRRDAWPLECSGALPWTGQGVRTRAATGCTLGGGSRAEGQPGPA